MKEYWNNPQETAGQIRDGWLYTGDIAVRDDEDYFSIVDRKKDMIIAGGYNLYRREIDEVLFHHPKVPEALSVGIPYRYLGEKALVILKPGEKATEEEIINFCKEKLGVYEVPKLVEFRDSLPKSAVGKVLRKILRVEGEAKKKNDGGIGRGGETEMGVLGGAGFTVDGLRDAIREVKSKTDKPFGVDLLLPQKLDLGGGLGQGEIKELPLSAILKTLPKPHQDWVRKVKEELQLPDTEIMVRMNTTTMRPKEAIQVRIEDKVPFFRNAHFSATGNKPCSFAELAELASGPHCTQPSQSQQAKSPSPGGIYFLSTSDGIAPV